MDALTSCWIARVQAATDFTGASRLASELLPEFGEDLIAEHREWLREDFDDAGRLRMAYRSFVLRHAGEVIVIDAAVGEDKEFPNRPAWHHAKTGWLNDLGRAGARPDEVTAVFLTHLHADHVGWLTRRAHDSWVPTFPNARHLVSAVEMDHWARHADAVPFMARAFPDSIAPVREAGLFEFVEPGAALGDLRVVDLAGHSPGMLGLHLMDGERVAAAFTADLAHHPVQFAAPVLSTIFCADPAAARSRREHHLARYAADGTLLFCGHFAGGFAGTVEPHGSGYRFVRC